MNNNYWLLAKVFIVMILATVLLVGCGRDGGGQQNGTISEITMTTAVDDNDRPLSPTSVYPVDAAALYCSFKLSGFPVGSKVRVEWIYVGGDPEVEDVVGQNFLMQEDTATIMREGAGYTTAIYTRPPIPDYKWPKGAWKIVIYVDEEEKGSASFKVE